MDENLKNLYIISKTYIELYKCCEEISAFYIELEEKESIAKKSNFKELLKKYNKKENGYLDQIKVIKKKIEKKLDQFILLQNNLKIKKAFIKTLEDKKIF